jgi:alpha-glucoside transport system substrate-binding protein
VVESLVDSDLIVGLGPEATAEVNANYDKAAIDLMTVQDRLHGVLYRTSLKSLVWYPPKVFASNGYEIPDTWDELLALTERMKRDGFSPWCFALSSFGSTGWVGTDWVEDLVLRIGGPDYYKRWVAGEVSFDDEPVRTAFDTFGGLVRTPGNVFGGVPRSLGVNWARAADPMFGSAPACLLHRQASFYRGSLPSGVEIGNDVDVFVLPAVTSQDNAPLVLAGDIAVGFDERPEVQSFLTYLATPESGEAWAQAGGYHAPHVTFDLDNYPDPFARRIGQLLQSADTLVFDGSDQMPPAVGTGTFWDGVTYYVGTGDLDGTMELIQAGFG